MAVVALMGVASAQALDVQAPSRSGDRCEQSILLQVASSRSGAVALSASFAPSTPDRVLLSVALRYSRALFGVEFGLKAQFPDIVESIVEMEGARMSFGTAGAAFVVEIVDLLYLRNTGTEFVTFPLPLEVFLSLSRAPQPTVGRIDTERVYLEFDLSAAFFDALADGFVRECLGAGATASSPAPSAPAARGDPPRAAAAPIETAPPCYWRSNVPVGIVESPSDTMVCVNIAVLRVRDAPGLQANVVGRAELGMQGRLVGIEHRDVDGFRWWHVHFVNGLMGWVADGDDDLDYLVRVKVMGGTLGRMTPFAPLPDLAPLAAAVFEATATTAGECMDWAMGRSVAVLCGRLVESPSGGWDEAALAMRERIEPVLRASGMAALFPWQFDGGDGGLSMHTEWMDEAQLVWVVVSVVDTEPRSIEVALLQQHP